MPQANPVTTVLYTGWAKILFPVVLVLILLAASYPFGMLAAGYRMAPFFAKPTNAWEKSWMETMFDTFDESGTIIRGWIYTIIAVVLLFVYFIGLLYARRNYAFARTLHTVKSS